MRGRVSFKWLLLLIALPIASQSQTAFHSSRWSIAGTVLFAEDNRPAENVKVELKRFTGSVAATVFTRWGGVFEAGSLSAGTYLVVVEESGYEPIRETVQLDGTNIPGGLWLYLRRAHSTSSNPNSHVVSVRELSIPAKARKAFQEGLELRAKKNPSGSLAHFQRAVAEFPSYYEAYAQMGLAYLQLGQAAQAEKALRQSIELSGDSSADVDFALSSLLLDQGQFAEAEKVIRRGLGLAPTSWLGHFQLARALLGMKRVEEAGQSAEKARSLKPDSSMTFLLLANIHLAQEEYAAQLRDVDEYLRLDPNGAFSARAREIRTNVQRILSHLQNSPTAIQGEP